MYKIQPKKECHYDGVIELNLKIVTTTEDRKFLPDVMEKAFTAGAELTKKILLEHPQISHALVIEASVGVMEGEEDPDLIIMPEASGSKASTYSCTEMGLGGWSNE
jgi:hypothetical protein